MKLRLLISLASVSLALTALKVCAQSADDFFHTGAQAYLTNNTASAREQVDKGLKLYPNDDKLKKLDELLKQQKQQQNQQQQQQKNQQQQQNQSQQNQSQSKEDQQKKKDQDKKDEQKKQDQDKKDQQKPDQQQDQKQDKNDEKQPPKDQPTPGEMTPDEAKKLLDSQKGDEKLLPANQNKQGDRRHLKDW
jgi:outer membrane biosynthesis protein TonB